MKIQFTPKAILEFISRVTFGLVSFSTNIELLADVLTNTSKFFIERKKTLLFLSFFLLVVVRREGFVHRGRSLTRGVMPSLLLLRFWDFL